jgi:hypothetical protein
MDLIYNNTIVAAESADANAGLPGVGGRPRLQRQLYGRVGPLLELVVSHSQHYTH